MVVRIWPYVDGRPMPFSSSVFTSVASVKRGGGWVKFCFVSRLTSVSTSPSFSGGRALAFSVPSSSSSSFIPSWKTARKPANFCTSPEARRV